MTPRVSVVIAAREACEACGAGVHRVVRSLQEQEFEGWEALVVRAPGAAARDTGDARVRVIEARGASVGAAWNAGIDAARGQWVLLADERTWWRSDGLRALIEAAERGGAGAFGACALVGAGGERLRVDGGDVARLGRETLLERMDLPMGAMVHAASLLRGVPAREGVCEAACGHDLALRLAEAGGAWISAGAEVARREIDGVLSVREAMRRLRESARVALDADDRAGGARRGAAKDRLEALGALALGSMLDESAEGLVQEMLRSEGLEAALQRAGRAALECEDEHRAPSAGAGGASAAVWWARRGLIGAAPAAMREVARVSAAGLIGSNERAPAIIARACAGSASVVLLGLGKNARAIARALRGVRTEVLARDEAQASPPAWAGREGPSVRMLDAGDAWDREALHVMTVLDDEGFMRRVPSGLRVLRWREVLAGIGVERDAWLARGGAA